MLKGEGMKYGIDITLKGYLEVEAETEAEARAKVEDGYSLSDVQVIDDEIDDINEVAVRSHE